MTETETKHYCDICRVNKAASSKSSSLSIGGLKYWITGYSYREISLCPTCLEALQATVNRLMEGKG